MLVLVCTLTAGPVRAGTLVQMNYEGFGSVQIDLFDDLVSTTVTNFLQYVNGQKYDATMIHRVDTGLGVIQGGGFDTSASPISTFATIPLQYSRANTRGTISMARQSGADTASSQWFINTDDNTDSLGQGNNGGYAVFGWVVGPGMNVVDSIAAVPTFAYNSPFGQVPLTNFTQQDMTNSVDPLPHVVKLTSVTVVKTHAAYQNPYLVGDVDNSGDVRTHDILLAINEYLANGAHDLTSPFSGTDYVDASGNGVFTAQDINIVISAYLANASPLVSPLVEPLGSPLAIVPEPSSLLLGAGSLVVGRLCGAPAAPPSLGSCGGRTPLHSP